MASGYSDAEQKINLSVLQQKDPYIVGIADSASQVAAYSFNAALNEWEKTNIEGTLFVYTRSAFPLNGFMIINRLHLNDLIEPINKNLEFQLQDPFLLYKNSQSAIYGIWFYDRDECARIGQLMNSLVQVATDTQNQESGRQRRASESDTVTERPLVAVDATMCTMSPQKNNVDILQMLSKAQDEYDKSKTQTPKKEASSADADRVPNSMAGTAACSSPTKRANGASPPGNKHYAAYNGVILGQSQPGLANHQQNATTHINLETLFKKALQQNEKAFNDQRAAGNNMKSAFHLLPIPLSNQTTPTVEEIERAQRESTAGSSGLTLAGGSKDASSGTGGVSTNSGGYHHRSAAYAHQSEIEGSTAPESPNTALRRTLKIIPPSSSSATSGNPPRPSSVANRDQAARHADTSQANKHQPTVVQALFSQQTGRLSSQGIASRTSISSLFGGSQHPPAAAGMKYAQPDEAMRDRSWPTMECLPPTNTLPEKQSQRCTPVVRELFARQTSVEGLAKPDNFLAIVAKNPDIGLTATNTTTLLSPMAFQTPGKMAKCKSTMPDLEEVGQQQTVSAILKEASDLFKNHMAPRNRSPYSETPLPAEPDMPSVTPLSKEQLRQALITLLKTDNTFIAAIHEAYTASLNNELTRQRNRRDSHF